ncbi:hypothetical protein ACHAPO_005311 [Fusarium lateritium]
MDSYVSSLLVVFLGLVSVVAILAVVSVAASAQKRMEKNTYHDIYAAIQDAATARKGGETSSNKHSDGEVEEQNEPKSIFDETSKNTAV